jgi:hypothetical protein
MLGCWGRVQSADGVIHLIVDRVNDLSAQLKTVSNLEDGFPLDGGSRLRALENLKPRFRGRRFRVFKKRHRVPAKSNGPRSYAPKRGSREPVSRSGRLKIIAYQGSL